MRLNATFILTSLIPLSPPSRLSEYRAAPDGNLFLIVSPEPGRGLGRETFALLYVANGHVLRGRDGP